MVLAIVLKLVPAIATTVLASLVNTAVLALLTRGSSAAEPPRTPTRRRKPVRARGSRCAQEDLVSLRRRTTRRVG
jgi:hypothetical protein